MRSPRIWIAALLLTAASAPAQEAQQVLDEAFGRLDRNGDGRIERAEFPGSDAQFAALGAALGAGDDGAVSADEFARSALGRRLVAARVRDASQARPRIDADARLALRIDAALRLDRNRDGRVARDEWTLDDATFAELDLDADGDVDRSDAAEARRRAPGGTPPPTVPDLDRLDGLTERQLQKLDRDGDGALSEAEVRGHRLAAAFAWADRDRDGKLGAEELGRLVAEARRQVDARNRGDARRTAYRVPFATWDQDKNGKLETAEWKGPKSLFARIDQDRDAALTEVEVARYVRAVEGSTFLERFDLDDDGRVTLEEFGGPPGAFRRADRNGDGAVSRADR